jgi:hypothetical protein
MKLQVPPSSIVLTVFSRNFLYRASHSRERFYKFYLFQFTKRRKKKLQDVLGHFELYLTLKAIKSNFVKLNENQQVVQNGWAAWAACRFVIAADRSDYSSITPLHPDEVSRT